MCVCACVGVAAAGHRALAFGRPVPTSGYNRVMLCAASHSSYKLYLACGGAVLRVRHSGVVHLCLVLCARSPLTVRHARCVHGDASVEGLCTGGK